MHQATWMVHHIKNDAGHSVNSTGQMDHMNIIWKDASHFFFKKGIQTHIIFQEKRIIWKSNRWGDFSRKASGSE